MTLPFAERPAPMTTPSMLTIAQAARAAAKDITGSDADAIAHCKRDGDIWKVQVDVLESKAKLDNNDLLAAYIFEFDLNGELTGFTRAGRYLRTEDNGAALSDAA